MAKVDDSRVDEKGSVESILDAQTPVDVRQTGTRFLWRVVALVLFLALAIWLTLRIFRS